MSVIYTTQDIWLTAAMMLHGQPLKSIESVGRGIGNMSIEFSDALVMDTLIKMYWDKDLSVDALEFQTNIKELKSRLISEANQTRTR